MKQLTKQQVFDRVAQHLLAQMEKSEADGCCLYRGPGGLKCAIGCLIPDECYRDDMEQISAEDLNRRFPVEMHKAGLARINVEFLLRLQEVHDWAPTKEWHDRLWTLAGEFRVKRTVLK